MLPFHRVCSLFEMIPNLIDQHDLRDVRFVLCFEVSRCLLMSFSAPYPITKLFAQVVQKTNLPPWRDFVAHSLLIETKESTSSFSLSLVHRFRPPLTF